MVWNYPASMYYKVTYFLVTGERKTDQLSIYCILAVQAL